PSSSGLRNHGTWWVPVWATLVGKSEKEYAFVASVYIDKHGCVQRLYAVNMGACSAFTPCPCFLRIAKPPAPPLADGPQATSGRRFWPCTSSIRISTGGHAPCLTDSAGARPCPGRSRTKQAATPACAR